MSKMPVIFVGHGSPTNIIEKNEFTKGWATITENFQAPKSILCISAHLFVEENLVTGTKSPKTIHDFYGFPEELYEVKYPVQGSPDLAAKVTSLVDDVNVDQERGLDHGAWSPLCFMYPDAQIPVVQLSVNASNSTQENFNIGKALKPLREEGVLIMGSGNIVHNLPMVNWDMVDGYNWADEFDQYIKSSITNGHYEDVIHYENAGSSAEKAFPYRDHYDPLLYVLGAVDTSDPIQVFNDARVMGSMSMTSYLWG